MLMSNFLKSRKSVRDFKKKKMDTSSINKLLSVFKELEEEADDKYFNFVLFEDGEKVFNLLNGLAGYSGIMIESPHYVGIRLKEVNDTSIIMASYYTEKMMTKLVDLNLGSCWIDVKHVEKDIKSKAFGNENKNIGYIVAFGYPKLKNPFSQSQVSSRYSIEDIVYRGEFGSKINLDELEQRGLDDLFYYIRFAPSNYNKQPWRFVLKQDKVILYLEISEDGKTDLMDAGIIMYYFEELAKTIGLINKWKLIDTPYVEYDNHKYRPIGEYRL